MENVHEKLKKYKCDKCDKNFTQKIGLKLHSTAIHEKMKKINCNQCVKIFLKDLIWKYIIHIQNIHETEKISTKPHAYEPIDEIIEMIDTQPLRNARFKCKICKKEIIGKYNVKVHIENVHKGFKKYKCDECI